MSSAPEQLVELVSVEKVQQRQQTKNKIIIF